jgi:capsular polysaccharide transport system permease protein
VSDFVAPQPGLLGAFRIQARVIGALTLRELGTRFGRDNLGYVWLFLEPMMLGGALGALHLASGHSMPGGLDPFVFWVVGYIPFYLFRGIVNRAPSGIAGNQSLLYHRRITVFDIMLSRHLLESAAVGIALGLYLLVFGAVLGEWPEQPGKIVIGMLLMLGLAHGLALLIAAGSVYTELFDRMTHLLTYPAFADSLPGKPILARMAPGKPMTGVSSTALAEKSFPVIRPWFCDIGTKCLSR